MATNDFLRAREAWMSHLLCLGSARRRRVVTVAVLLGVCLLCACSGGDSDSAKGANDGKGSNGESADQSVQAGERKPALASPQSLGQKS